MNHKSICLWAVVCVCCTWCIQPEVCAGGTSDRRLCPSIQHFWGPSTGDGPAQECLLCARGSSSDTLQDQSWISQPSDRERDGIRRRTHQNWWSVVAEWLQMFKKNTYLPWVVFLVQQQLWRVQPASMFVLSVSTSPHRRKRSPGSQRWSQHNHHLSPCSHGMFPQSRLRWTPCIL